MTEKKTTGSPALALAAAALFAAACGKPPQEQPSRPQAETPAPEPAAPKAEEPAIIPAWTPPPQPFQYEEPSFQAEAPAASRPAAPAVQSPARPPQEFQKDRSGRPLPPRPPEIRGPGNPGPQ